MSSSTVTETHVLALLDLVESARPADPEELFYSSVLTGLRELIPCDYIRFQFMDVRRRTLRGVEVADDGITHDLEDPDPDVEAQWWAGFWGEGGCSYPIDHDDYVTILRRSDQHGDLEYARTVMGAMMGSVGVRHHVVVPLPPQGAIDRRLLLYRCDGRDFSDLDQIRPLDPAEDFSFVTEAVGQLVGELGATPLIGFAGAPFTLASYLVEGGPSREHAKTKALMYGDEETWHALAGKLASIAAAYLRLQVDAGVSAVQLFDSWAGALSADDYARYVLPHSKAVLAAVPEVPRIHFGVGTGELLPLMAEAGADVVGVDWRVPLDEAAKRVGGGHALQGNLDPSVVFAPWPVVAERARDVLRRGASAEGHIFNLGHGVMPDTDPDVLARIVELVHEETRR